ncbi:hypothetical protein EV126DRAFT_200476 [Verticillium dahliae]|nr:hypothetical protein EV126DRAFT_200476 [Verticillium dahliae]
MNRFLRQSFIGYPEFVGRDFYIAGSHMAVPGFPRWQLTFFVRKMNQQETSAPASTLQNRCHSSIRQHLSRATTTNLKGNMIINGLVRQSVQNSAVIEAAWYGAAGAFSSERCHEFAPLSPWCKQNLPVCETKDWLTKGCLYAQKKCGGLTSVVLGELTAILSTGAGRAKKTLRYATERPVSLAISSTGLL